MPDAPDPTILERLKKQPPYEDETPEEVEETKETPEVKEEVVEEVEKVEEKVEEPEKVEEKVEEKEEVKEPEEEKEEETKKRTTEQFEKLKEHNKALKEENVALKRKNVLDSLQPEEPVYPQPPVTNVLPLVQQYPGLTPQEIKDTFAGLVDENGYVDTGLLIGTLKDLQKGKQEAEQRAVRAEQKVDQVARSFDDFQRNETMRKVHEKFPRLDPENEDFDERLWEGVRNEVIGQWTQGKQEDVMAAAGKWSEILYGKEVEVKKAEKEKADKAETDKRNINALSSKPTSQRTDWEDHEELVKATQKGVRGSIIERMRKSGLA